MSYLAPNRTGTSLAACNTHESFCLDSRTLSYHRDWMRSHQAWDGRNENQ